MLLNKFSSESCISYKIDLTKNLIKFFGCAMPLLRKYFLLLYFRPSFYHLRLQLGAELGVCEKQDELENPSNFSSIFPSTAIEL